MAEQKPKTEGKWELPHPSHLLRDVSALVGGATVLLYLLGHLYSAYYLSVFGVSEGYDGLSLASLTAIPSGSILLLVTVCVATYWLLVRKTRLGKWRDLALDVGALLVIGYVLATPSLPVLLQGARLDEHTIRSYFYAAFYVVIFFIASRYGRNRANELDDLLDKMQSEINKLSLTDEQRASSMADHLALKARIQRTRIRSLALCAYMAVVFYVPSVGEHRALSRLDENQTWKAPDGGLPRIPVYWVGDRYVYVTNDGKECLVHVQISQVEQARFVCPDVVQSQTKP